MRVVPKNNKNVAVSIAITYRNGRRKENWCRWKPWLQYLRKRDWVWVPYAMECEDRERWVVGGCNDDARTSSSYCCRLRMNNVPGRLDDA
eukprot:scaffold142631_cov47-Attheya_sp.AAC.3